MSTLASPPVSTVGPLPVVTDRTLGATVAGLGAALLSTAAFGSILLWQPSSTLPAAVAAGVAALAVFVTRGLADYVGARPPVIIGLVLQAAALASWLFVPAPAVAWAVLLGLGAGLAAPAALGLAFGGARVTGAPTPRVLLPRRFVVPFADRGTHRGAVACSVVAFALFAAAASVSALFGLWPAPIAIAPVSAALLAVGLVRGVRLADPLSRAEASGAILAPGLALFAAMNIAVALLAPLEPKWLALLGALVVAAAAAGPLVVRERSPRSVRLATAGSAAFRAATKSFDATKAPAPQSAAVVRSVHEVRQALAAARAADLGVRAHSTGHAAGTSVPFAGDALLKVLIDEPVTVDAAARTVRIPAGASWRDVVLAITPHGLGAPHGSSSHVGAVGYLLRGGLSAYGRTTGVAANSIESIEVVLADGELVLASRDVEPELFWALRGGGGGFGVVTALTVRLFELHRVVTGTALWPAEHAAQLADAWQSWTRTAPESITTSLRLLQFPALPGLPKVMTNRPMVVVDGTAVAARPADVEPAQAVALDLLTRLRSVAAPVLDSWKVASAYETPITHMDPPIGPAHTGDSFTIADPSGQGVSSFVAHGALGAEAGLSSLELRQLGGGLGRAPRDGGATASYAGDFAYWGVSLHSKSLTEQSARAGLGRMRAALQPWNTGLVVPTFAPDPSLPQRLFDDATAQRAQRVRDAVDPHGVFARDIAPGALVAH